MTYEFPNSEPVDIKRMVKERGAEEDFYWEEDGPTVSWHWLSMIAHLDDDAIVSVVRGENSSSPTSAVATSAVSPSDMASSCGSWGKIESGVSCGDGDCGVTSCTAIVPYLSRPRTLIGCELVVTPCIDTRRHNAAKKAAKKGKKVWPEGSPMYIWHFMLKRNDGTVCMLHPKYGFTKFPMYEGVPERNIDVPRNGLGGSDAPGDFRRRINDQVTKVLSFDARKTPPGVYKSVVIPDSS